MIKEQRLFFTINTNSILTTQIMVNRVGTELFRSTSYSSLRASRDNGWKPEIDLLEELSTNSFLTILNLAIGVSAHQKRSKASSGGICDQEYNE